MYHDDYDNNFMTKNGGKPRKKNKSSRVEKLGQGLFKTIKDFCMETSIHGFYHMAVPRRHIIERLLWVTITACAIYMVINISLDQWQRYNENPTVVTLEKDFRNWKFPLPGITECATNKNDPAKAKQMIKTLWNVDPGDDKYAYYMSFVDTVANSNLTHLEGFRAFTDDPTLNIDMYQLAVGVMPELVVKPTWVEGLSPKWIPVMTEAGVCYTTNSVAIADIVLRPADRNETSLFPVNCKYASFSCYVTLEVGSCVKFFLHSPYDVADTGTFARELCPLYNRNVGLGVVESVCGPGVRDLSIRRRRCLYTDEATSSYTNVYSMNMCRRACRNKLAVKLCGCKPFYNIYEDGQTCDVAGMACLSEHKERFSHSLECACTPQCEDAAYQELSFDEAIWDRGVFVSRGSVRIAVQAPRERYTREIVFHFQDLVVSFGGAAGFFLGASFLSFVEIVYFILERTLTSCKKKRTKSTANGVQQSAPPKKTLEQQRIQELTSYIQNTCEPKTHVSLYNTK